MPNSNKKVFSVYDIFQILLNNWQIAIKDLDRAKKENQSPETISILNERYLFAKYQWQCLHQVHGSMIANINWEATFCEFCMDKKYSSVDECISQAMSYGKYGEY